jgi:flagellar hook-associated protein 2
MSGIQISGLIANASFDWKSVVDQLIAADSIPVTKLTTQQTTNTQKITALSTLQTSLSDLQDAVQAMRTDNVFSARMVSSDTSGTTWKSGSVTGAAIGNYTFDVTKLATAGRLAGASAISSSLSTSADVTGVTLATMRTATAVSAGAFTVNGKQVVLDGTESLQDVFTKISDATGTHVTASYHPNADPTKGIAADGITLTSDSGELVLGAANDSSNFLAVMKLANNGTTTASSAAPLATLKVNSTLASAGLVGSLITPPIDASGNGSFSLNGVAITYNINTDNLGKVLARINASAAGVTAAYDSANDRVVLANKTTGDTGIAASEASGGLLDALGLSASTGGTLVHGTNAQFTVNGGPLLSSSTNTLDASVHGITGLSVTVNSETKQTLQVQSDVPTMNTEIQNFITKFNAVQDFIDTNTKITVSGTTVTPSLLSDNRDIQDWARNLQQKAFEAVSGLTGSVTRLSDLGIDFDGISGHLAVKDSGKLATALGDHPDDVNSFFLKGTASFIPKMYGYLSTVVSSDRGQQSSLTKANTDIASQITALQSRLDDERTSLTNAFIAMLDAQSSAQTQQTYLTSAFFNNNNNNSCWVARAVYGARNPRWLLFRHWLLHRAPGWFRALYLRHGERFAGWLADKPRLRAVIRRWMDVRIANLVPALASL